MREEILSRLKPITDEEQALLNGNGRIDPSIYNLNRTMIVDCQKLLEHGRLIELRTHTRFVHFPKHTHNYVEVVYMCSGQTRHLINDSEVILREGELLFLNQHASQEIFPASADDIAVNFIILPEFFDQSLSMIGTQSSLIRDFLIECLRNSSQGISYLHFKAADILPVQNLVENLIWMLLNRQPNKRRLDSTTMGLLFLHLMHFTDKMEIAGHHPEQELLLQVFRFIEDRYRDGELSELAAANHCTLYGLSRIIKEAAGKTYTELVQEKRLKQAVYLLLNTNLSITDICLDVGYHNFSYFYRIFKEKYGLPPKQFRKQAAEDRKKLEELRKPDFLLPEE